jgi:hypothetical protein
LENPLKKFQIDDPWMSNDLIGVKTWKIRRKNSEVMTPERQMIPLELKLGKSVKKIPEL